ncbi:DUF1758 domain-containing protein [Trichonephila clavipes]|nr:DUF1758 domain-containing protein [Trichonephila clavipes]
MKEVVAKNDNSEIAYYMPHHGIFRPEKSTTKLRVVFNATNPTSNGLSLNSIQYNGGLVQNDLLKILNKFRDYPYAFTADVKMMYRITTSMRANSRCVEFCGKKVQRIR